MLVKFTTNLGSQDAALIDPEMKASDCTVGAVVDLPQNIAEAVAAREWAEIVPVKETPKPEAVKAPEEKPVSQEPPVVAAPQPVKPKIAKEK